MTVSYSGDAFSVTFGLFWRMLFRYQGSAWKAVYPEVIFIASIYSVITVVYRVILFDPYKQWFELAIMSVGRVVEQIPIGFIMGFYVTMVYGRSWKQFLCIPNTYKLSMLFTTYINGKDEASLVLRRTLIRYATLSWTLAMRTLNVPIKMRFPTMRHLVDAGLMTETELQSFDKLQSLRVDASFFAPLSWCASLTQRAFAKKQIKSGALVVDMLNAIDEFRKMLQVETSYDQVNVPLVYTQAVVFGTYSFFLAGTVGYQIIPSERYQILKDAGHKVPSHFKSVDTYIPIFALVQLFIYAGLFKVAESLLNPHGENDDDFEICDDVDHNLNRGYLMVTEMHDDLPELQQDMYWDVKDISLPYTEAAYHIQEKRPNPTSHLGSLFHFSVKRGAQFLSIRRRRLTNAAQPNVTSLETSQICETELTSDSDHLDGIASSPSDGLIVRMSTPEESVLDEPSLESPREPAPTAATAAYSEPFAADMDPNTIQLVQDTVAVAKRNQLNLKPVKIDSPLLFVDDSDSELPTGASWLNKLAKRKKSSNA